MIVNALRWAPMHPGATAVVFLALLLLLRVRSGLRRRRDACGRDVRAATLKRVRQIWIEDVLEASLGRHARSALGLTNWPKPVLQRRMELRRGGRSAKPLPPGMPIREVFDHVDGSLLILGPQGAGKTTALLELARDLLDRADHDAKQPMPVVFNLSSWAPAGERRPALADWLVEQLHHHYDVPRQIAEGWLNGRCILPLLDGLDEVAPSSSAGCISAINEFHRVTSLKLVVCCGQTYRNLPADLRLEDAIELQPLTCEQVDCYLKAVGSPLADIRAALQADDSCGEPLRSALMLNLMTLAYQGRTATALRVPFAHRRQRLFEDYTERMFERLSITGRYTKEQAIGWLTWLARWMRDNRQSTFYLDRLQPDCLPAGQRRLVVLIPAILSGLVGGLPVGLVCGLTSALAFGRGTGLGVGVAPGLRVWLGSGLVFALVAVSNGLVPEPMKELRSGLPRPVVALVGCLVAGLAVAAFRGPVRGLAFALICLGVRSVYTLVRHGRAEDPRRLITPIVKDRWPWLRLRSRPAGAQIAVVIALGIAALLVNTLASRWANRQLADGLGVLVSTLFSGEGLKGLSASLGKPRTPDQGIRTSARQALVLGRGVVLGVMMIFVLVFGLRALPLGLPGLVFVVGFGLSFGLVVGLVFGLEFGGIACLRHLALRGLLAHNGFAPWRYVDFLNDATVRFLLHRNGSGYIFVHPLLLDYFADGMCVHSGNGGHLTSSSAQKSPPNGGRKGSPARSGALS